jgi:RNA polymerase sigma-70 factor (ECF subfamily)
MEDEYRAVVAREKNRLFSFACYYLREASDAEDVIQEVLIKLWRHWRSLDQGELAAWLTTVTRNACLDALRRRSRQERRTASDEGLMEHVVDEQPGPARLAASAELGRNLIEAIRALPEPYRTVIVLREIQERPHQEIALVLDMPVATIKVYAHRGRKKLRERLAQTEPLAAPGGWELRRV